MIEFGKSLRLAREARGYSVAQLAETTRMAPKTVQELEDENFSHIAAPIYGRGFVKLYCEAVGLEAKPFIDEFMAIYRGERDVGIRERVVQETPMPKPQSSPTEEHAAADSPATMPEPAAPMPDATTMPKSMPEVAPVTAPEPPQPLTDLPIFGGATAPRKTITAATTTTEAPTPTSNAPLSRYAAPVRKERIPTLSPTIWRIGVLAAGAILIIWILFLGIRALYRATSGGSGQATEAQTAPAAEEAQSAKPAKEAQSAKPAAEEAPKPAGEPVQRQIQSIPSIYID